MAATRRPQRRARLKAGSMSRIDTLIAELCPDGVEHRKLGEISNIRKGEQLNKNSLLADGPYPVLNGGRDYSGYWRESNSKGGVVAVSQGGASAGFVSWIAVPFWAGAHCYVIEETACCEARYLLHVMKSCEAKFMQSQYGAGIPSLSAKTLAGTEIPIPPIEVQREIVRILDTFAALTDTLTEELDCRRQQYAYYRDRLLSRESLEALDGKPVEYRKLLSLTNIVYGFPFSSELFNDREGTPLIRIRDVMRGRSETFYQGEFDQEYVIHAGDILVGMDGDFNVGKWKSNDALLNQRVLRIETASAESINNDFLFHPLGPLLKKVNDSIQASTVKHLTVRTLKTIEIPVPSLTTQRKVVDILDRIDALTTSLTDGIPAEIEARRRQYEYYRDRLLDFPRKAIETE